MLRKILFIILILFLNACNTNNSWTCIEGDCVNGYGKRVWTDDGFEKGFWKNGKLNGEGIQFWGKNSEFAGDTYVGNFINDKPNGYGKYTDISEGTQYIGNWLEKKPNGKGFFYCGKSSIHPGQFYKGEWKNGLMHGYGIFYWGIGGTREKNKYSGEWKNDKMDGYGKYEWADGSYYEGNFKNDLQHGQGVFKFKNGKILNGIWNNGQFEELNKKNSN